MMKNVHLFGVTTPTGKYLEKKFIKAKKEFKFTGYSRTNLKYRRINFEEGSLFLDCNKNIFICCCPIWEFAKLIENIHKKNQRTLKKISCFVICSSTSIITKKFAFNNFDKILVRKLESAENALLNIAKKYKINCFIIRPTLIYGSIEGYSDKNIGSLTKIMRLMPFVLIPNKTGLRQPIHANQLASYIFFLTDRLVINEIKNIFKSKIINIGGDEELTYKSMLFKIKQNYPYNDPIQNCLIIEVPQFLFYLLISPLIILSPKVFELFLRLNSDLSGFSKPSFLLKLPPESFPVKPIKE